MRGSYLVNVKLVSDMTAVDVPVVEVEVSDAIMGVDMGGAALCHSMSGCFLPVLVGALMEGIVWLVNVKFGEDCATVDGSVVEVEVSHAIVGDDMGGAP